MAHLPNLSTFMLTFNF